MSARKLWVMIWGALLVPGVLIDCQAKGVQKRYSEETKSETLWRDSYSNCDYGFYVTLGRGVVGRGTHSPAADGFYVSLPDVGDTGPASDRFTRSLSVDAQNTGTDDVWLAGVVKHEIDVASQGRVRFRVTRREPTALSGLKAASITFEYDGQNRVIEKRVIAYRGSLRGGIVYTLAVRSFPDSISADLKEFRRIRRGFKLLPILDGACGNDR